MAKIPTDAYKGVRDFYPEDQFLIKWISEKMRATAESFGFVEYHASILEPSELYKGKTSEEIVSEQTYNFIDRGGREVTLRPEMTPTVARMVAARKRELTFPLRWYSIPNVFRYERPQRGRLREHWQLNCDIFGASGIEAEVEIISLAYKLMKSFGAKDEDFEIRINSRAFLIDVFKNHFNFSEEETKNILRILDRRDKLSEELYCSQIQAAVGVKAERFLEEWTHQVTSGWLNKFGQNFYYKSMVELCMRLANLFGGITTNIDFNLVRGFEYYTGVIFEIYDKNAENDRSLFGGGRYDNLLAMFGEEPIPAVGFGMGDVTIRDFLKTHDLLPEYKSTVDLFVATIDTEIITEAERLADMWREQGLNVAVNLSDKKVGEQIKSADKQKIPFVVVLGEDELKKKQIAVKKLSDGSEQEVVFDKVPSVVKK
jgi:histidyl-tRNA synthetase